MEEHAGIMPALRRKDLKSTEDLLSQHPLRLFEEVARMFGTRIGS
jgi:hypothetical protein